MALFHRREGLFASGRVLWLPADALKPNPDQPRQYFAPEGLEELAESIKVHGILQPLSVRRTDGGYVLVSGERRLRAARLAGLREVPCIVVEVDEVSSSLLALVENLQRRDLAHPHLPSVPGGGRPPHRQVPVGGGQQAAASEALPGAVGKAPLRRAHRAPRPGPAAAGGRARPRRRPGPHHRRRPHRGPDRGLHRLPPPPGPQEAEAHLPHPGRAALPQHGEPGHAGDAGGGHPAAQYDRQDTDDAVLLTIRIPK